jgi:hypothetical protein
MAPQSREGFDKTSDITSDTTSDITSNALLASMALTELSRLSASAYSPEVTAPRAPADSGLTRRPQRAEASEASAGPEPVPVRPRSATEVRGMLSGFRAGVERGRTSGTDGDQPATFSSPVPTAEAHVEEVTK